MTKTTPHILIVDDEPDIRDILNDIFLDENYTVSTAENAEQARKKFIDNKPDLVLLDIWMPDEDGISVLKKWVASSSLQDIPVIMISGHGTVENAVEAVKLGAYDFLEKPLSTDKLLLCVQRGLEQASLRQENKRLKNQIEKNESIITNSDTSKELMRHIQLFGPTDSWVFITGEPGTGKHMVARALHLNSSRSESAFVELNLAAISSDQVSQQLFGTVTNGKVLAGSFELAKGGTLYINEVLGLDLEAQNRLNSALQEKQFLPVGGTDYIEFDVRVIVSTSDDPQQAVDEGQFRKDLYYHLNVIPIHAPPLRERREDIPGLIVFTLEEIANRNKIEVPAISSDALKKLVHHDWPGNVKQLQNVLQRVTILNKGGEISQQAVANAIDGDVQIATPSGYTTEQFSGDLRFAKDRFEKAYLHHHLKLVKGNVAALSKKIGLERTHLYRKLKNLDIQANTLKK